MGVTTVVKGVSTGVSSKDFSGCSSIYYCTGAASSAAYGIASATENAAGERGSASTSA